MHNLLSEMTKVPASIRYFLLLITIHSKSIFIEDKTLPIKRQVDDINIVEYDGNDYVVYNNELSTK